MSDVAAALRAYREGFHGVALHRFLGLRLRKLRDPVVVELPLGEPTRGLGHDLHGGATASAMDVAASIAVVVSGPPDGVDLRTADVHIRYLAEASGPVIRVEARVSAVSAKIAVIECRAIDGDGTLVALGDFAAVVRSRPDGEST
jgi:uncharacterized protein (TIGR00369 family)